MQWIYNLAIGLFSFLFRVYALFNDKAKKGIQGRRDTFQKIKEKVSPDEDWIWVHCSSLGEFEQGRPVIEKLREEYPHYKIALSFFSPSGYEIRKNYNQADLIFYMPLDTAHNAKRLAEIFKPKLWILIKYDYWYNHLQAMRKQGVPIVVVSAVFRKNQIYFKTYGKWFAEQLKKNISYFFVQDDKSKRQIEREGITQVSVVGDTRYDRVQSIADQGGELPWIESFKQDKKLIVVGSSWREDEEHWVKWINNNKLPKNWKIVIAPHETTAKNITFLTEKLEVPFALYSEQKEIEKAQVLVINAIGFLSKIYAYATIAYVGGGYNKSGVHNTLEPAVYGIPIIIGLQYHKFNEVKQLKEKGVIFSVKTYSEFEQVLEKLMQEDSRSIYEKARAVFDENLGATNKVIEECSDYLLSER